MDLKKIKDDYELVDASAKLHELFAWLSNDQKVEYLEFINRMYDEEFDSLEEVEELWGAEELLLEFEKMMPTDEWNEFQADYSNLYT